MPPGNRAKRPHGQLRQSQLITTFGPGSLVDLPKHSVIVAGLDDWRGVTIEIPEPRLVFKIRMLLNRPQLRLMAPPPDTQKVYGSQTGVVGFRFPEWFITQNIVKNIGAAKRRFLVRLNRTETRRGALVFIDDQKKEHNVVPIRFVRACPKGHIGDIDWYGYVHPGNSNLCERQGRQMFVDEEGTSGDLSQLVVGCECGAQRRMIDAIHKESAALGFCNGDRPWLGKNAREECKQPNRLLVRSASNAYFPHVMGVISLPEKNENLARALESVWDVLQAVDNQQDLNSFKKAPLIKEALKDFTDNDVLKAITERKAGGEDAAKTVKQAELEVLLDSKKGSMADIPDGTFFARALNKTFNDSWMVDVDKVVLLHRLREVVAQIGFTRFEAESADIDGELSAGVERAELGLNTDWLPAVENKGEGFFIAFKTGAIEAWLERPAVKEKGKLFEEGFDLWAKSRGLKDAKFWGLPYIMLHSLSHLLITAVAMECGYPSSSIRERVYAIKDVGYGILLYTGSSDSEGTMGGLVEAGKNINRHLKNALAQAELCSNDPVCAQHLPNDKLEQRHLLGAACHGCLLIAETSCERFNQFLDRSLVVATVQGQGAEFFKPVGI